MTKACIVTAALTRVASGLGCTG